MSNESQEAPRPPTDTMEKLSAQLHKDFLAVWLKGADAMYNAVESLELPAAEMEKVRFAYRILTDATRYAHAAPKQLN